MDKKINIWRLLAVVFILAITVLVLWKTGLLTGSSFVLVSEESLEYSDDNFSFQYPTDYEVVKFEDRGDRLGTVRIRKGDIAIELEHNVGSDKSAYEYAGTMYESRDSHKYNQAPKEIVNENIEGYYLTRFIQNEEFNSLVDEAFFDTSKGVFELSMGLLNREEQRSYNEGHQAFLLLLNTLEVKF